MNRPAGHEEWAGKPQVLRQPCPRAAQLWIGDTHVNAHRGDKMPRRPRPVPESEDWSEPTHSKAARGAHAARGPGDDCRSVTATSRNLLTEQLQELAQALVAEYGHLSLEGVHTLVRMVRFMQELKELHAIDRKGRCRLCRARQHWWQRRQPCDVHAGLAGVFGRWPG
jgi:hypothetical protein